MTIEQEREAFEAWARGIGYMLKRSVRAPGGYWSRFGGELWVAWQARAALQEHLVAALVEKDVEIASLKHELSEMQFRLSGLDMRRQEPIPRRIEGEAKP